ncbi:MAG: bifunctional UDP-N-acetylglucosamine diphosphorylase/glucosamine-1-phosphate N-acetyltransferase GlmU [Alphaproteobacteria bacterium]|nr:bifunctional UDP-N-acetylglucosamine diphosphorylase/glucosamine-1-phosphate N-acetyltransferase GlmU [Alphaproteobacteria bacterium]
MTASKSLAVVILAAGKGTRMKSELPKVLHRVAGLPMVAHVMESVKPLRPDRIVVVIGPDGESVAKAVAPTPTAIQHERRGTGDAVKAARAQLKGFTGDVLIIFGDSLFLAPATLKKMIRRRRSGKKPPAVVVMGFRPDDPARYGRLVVDRNGRLERIVEWAEANEDERKIGLCNSGVMVVDGKRLFPMLDRISNKNAKGEFYLTDLVEIAQGLGYEVAATEAPVDGFHGIDSRADLAAAEALMQSQLRVRAMEEGVTLVAPETVFFAADTRLGRDVVVHPHVVFGPGVVIADNTEIRSFSHLEGTQIGEGAVIGPFARLRPGTRIGAAAHIGNFVELKATSMGAGAKANHLAYIGDASVGAKANIGAGTITCNYDGINKHQTEIGAGAFTGSNSTLVAPVRLGAGAYVTAGSVITENVESDAMAFGRSRQVAKPGRARTFRAERIAEKKSKA